MKNIYKAYLNLEVEIAKKLYSNEVGSSFDGAFVHGMKGKIPVYIPKNSLAYKAYLAGKKYVKIHPEILQ